MDKIEKLFESIDAKVLTEEVKTSLIEAFNTAVDSKAVVLADEKFASLEDEYAKSIDEMIDTAKKTLMLEQEVKITEMAEAKSKEICDTYAQNIQEEAEAKMNEELDTLKESFNKYIAYAAQQFIDENEAKWLQEEEVQKANAIQESFVKLAKGFGVEVSAITESKDETKVELEKAIDTNSKLTLEIKRLNKEIMLDEAVSDLTAPQADRFMKLMEEVTFESEKQFTDKIELYKSAISVTKVQESKKKEVIDESDKSNLPSWKR